MSTGKQIHISCMLVEDEQWARNLMLSYISSRSELVLNASVENGQEALDVIKKKDIQLIFLDIELPGLSGLDILSKVENLPYIIFTTVHKKYAIDAFDIGAVDYLIKPIDKERFNIAVDRAINKILPESKNVKKELSKSKLISVLQNKYNLTMQEAMICFQIREGKNRQGILDYFKIKSGTLKFHLKTIYSKTIERDNKQAEYTTGKMQMLTTFLFQLKE